MSVCLDHLVVVAADLETGVRRVEAALGVSLTPGGTHARMATHNYLLRLSSSTYLEVIAPDVSVPRPARPRWFGLDRLRAPADVALAGWVARCDDVHATQTACADVLGAVVPMTRDDWAWQITLRADGELPLGGVVPALIEWQTSTHPAASLPEVGCSLLDLSVYHPDPERVYGAFSALQLHARPRVYWSGEAEPYIEATLQTPAGRRVLRCA